MKTAQSCFSDVVKSIKYIKKYVLLVQKYINKLKVKYIKIFLNRTCIMSTLYKFKVDIIDWIIYNVKIKI